ncbi:MAG: gene transfer agent family protein [Erythrobacter sp.]
MSRPANPMRGEADFAVGGRTFLLRPSFEALVAAEEELGSLFALVERASQGSLTIREITALIWHCLDPEARPTRDMVGAAVIERGLVAATVPVRVILAQVLKGRS